jgi:hypothetical protein
MTADAQKDGGQDTGSKGLEGGVKIKGVGHGVISVFPSLGTNDTDL